MCVTIISFYNMNLNVYENYALNLTVLTLVYTSGGAKLLWHECPLLILLVLRSGTTA